MQETQLIFAVIGYGCLGIAAGYSFTVLIAVLAWRLYSRRPASLSALRPPVTVLKPLCGEGDEVYSHLRSFCLQDYSPYQIVFGALDPVLSSTADGYTSQEGVPVS